MFGWQVAIGDIKVTVAVQQEPVDVVEAPFVGRVGALRLFRVFPLQAGHHRLVANVGINVNAQGASVGEKQPWGVFS